MEITATLSTLYTNYQISGDANNQCVRQNIHKALDLWFESRSGSPFKVALGKSLPDTLDLSIKALYDTDLLVSDWDCAKIDQMTYKVTLTCKEPLEVVTKGLRCRSGSTYSFLELIPKGSQIDDSTPQTEVEVCLPKGFDYKVEAFNDEGKFVFYLTLQDTE